SKSDLTKQLQELKTELLSLSLCVQKIASLSASKLSQISTIHKSITRVLTVMNQKAHQNLQEYYKNKKYLPLDRPAHKENPCHPPSIDKGGLPPSCYSPIDAQCT
ncbi:hypothetical protein BS47DRAFT_1429537, partial [Hydnum rufescens UP504]